MCEMTQAPLQRQHEGFADFAEGDALRLIAVKIAD
jgi:hypothetical protein